MREFYPEEYDENDPEIQEFIVQALEDLDRGEPVRVFIGGIVTDEGLRRDIGRLREAGIEVIVPNDN